MANEWNKTAFVEFETMLRRHLRSGAAPVTACAGFDFDAASAYLEGALGGPHLASYESHLAGCAMCRSHLIELARLSQAAPLFEARPAAATDRIPAWNRWKETVAGWFDLSTWNLKWQIAGATGAALAILIVAFGAQSWRRASNQAAVMVSNASATSPPAAESAVQTLPSPTPEPSTQDPATLLAQDPIAGRLDRSPITVPTPAIGPKDNAPNVPDSASSELLALNSSQPSEAPVAPNSGAAEAKPSPPPRPRASAPINDLSRAASESVWDEFRDGPRDLAANETAHGPDAIPRMRPDLVGNKPKPPSKSQPNNPLSRRALEAVREMMKLPLSPLGKLSFTESEKKAKPDKQESSDDETSKPMLVMIRGKLFDFEKGMLTDREYKPEMQKWNVWTLRRGSEEYKRALADDPMLKEFFDQAPILIVWGDRIYKVLK